MPKAAILNELQLRVQARVQMSSACEVGRHAGLHRSTVLRFCDTGRATPRTAQKLQGCLASTMSKHSGVAMQQGGSAAPTVESLKGVEMSHDLKTLRAMLQTMITLIDVHIGGVQIGVMTEGAGNADAVASPLSINPSMEG